MGFYIRKSVKAGPFRFNLSKSGVGLSVGVRGLRFGTGPRGHYVHAGVGGFYYRSSLGSSHVRKINHLNSGNQFSQQQPPNTYDHSGVRMVEVDSSDVLLMQDSRAEEVVNEINNRSAKVKLSKLFGWLSFSLAAVLFFAAHQSIFITVPIAVAACLLGKWLDSFRRVTVVVYQFDNTLIDRFSAVVEAFESLAKSNMAWHVPAGGVVRDMKTWKRNAGASHVVQKNRIQLTLGLPEIVKCNIDVPRVPVGKQVLYFFPDYLLVFDGKKAGGVSYENLRVIAQHSNFIEEGKIPKDTEIIGRTWKHPNKNGGPDRRFASNYEIPICAYESVLFESTTGVKELIEVSKRGKAMPFRESLIELSSPSYSSAPNWNRY
jgi:Protein of unknown function (DUF4236)